MGTLTLSTDGARANGDPFLDELEQVVVVAADASQVQLEARTTLGPALLTFHGVGFTYGADGTLTGGTVTGFDYSSAEAVSSSERWTQTVSIRDIAINATEVQAWLAEDGAAMGIFLAGDDTIHGTSFGDFLRGYSGADTIFGGPGDDAIRGRAGITNPYPSDYLTPERIAAETNYLRGDEGNDTVAGSFGFDDINGNMGNDVCYGAQGNDWVVGGKDDDRLYGDFADSFPFNNPDAAPGDDIVYGNLGNDTCDGGGGADLIRGGQGNDSLAGGGGDDWLSGDRGDDTITGGLGADVFHSFAEAGLDRVTDFSRAQGDRVVLDPGTSYTVRQFGFSVIIDFGDGNQMVLAGVQLSDLTGGWIGYA